MDEIYNKDKLVHLKPMKYDQINENNVFNLFNYIAHNGTWGSVLLCAINDNQFYFFPYVSIWF